MNNHTILDAKHLKNTHQQEIKATVNNRSILISTLLLVIAIVIFYLSNAIDDKTSALYLILLISPFAILAYALFRFVFRSKQLVYQPTNSPLCNGDLYFDKSQLEIMKSMLQSDASDRVEWPEFKHNGNARLHYIVSQDAKFAAVQLYEYIPYHFEAVSDIFYYTHNNGHPVAQHIMQSRAKAKS